LGDWFLALAAYNAGLGSISRTVARTGVDDFWGLARSGMLANETASYVPRFIAVTLIINDLQKYGFSDGDVPVVEARADDVVLRSKIG
jgi:membrane-bound lytic murein transglycosylase D